jgi:hemoglobin-like flavoprotein
VSTSKVTIHPLSNVAAAPRGIAADEALIQRLQASFRTFTERGTELADRFYARLFSEHPEVRRLFPANMAAQKKKLLDTLTLVIENLRSPSLVRARVEQLGVAHVDYGAKTEHYPWVAHALVSAMADMGGPQWTSELHADWTGAIRLVAILMMDAVKARGKETAPSHADVKPP